MKRVNVLLAVGCLGFVVVEKACASGKSIACGYNHMLAITATGQAVAWGDNEQGQLGYGLGGNLGYDPNIGYWVFDHSTIASNVVGMDQVRMVAAGDNHSLALKNDGTVWAWGYRYFGQLGNGELYVSSGTNRPIKVSGLSGVVKVAGGYYFSVALKDDGTVWAWGYNGRGSLGDGTTTWRSTPVQTVGLSDMTDVFATGGFNAFAIKKDGSLWGWGENAYGELGDGTAMTRTTPVSIVAVTGAVSVAAGNGGTQVLTRDGSVWIWGMFSADNSPADIDLTVWPPLKIEALSNVVAIGGDGLALQADGTLWQWYYYQTGGSWTGDLTNTLTLSQIGADVVEIASYGSAAIKKDGTVWTWGNNGFGQLGNGTTTGSTNPVQVVGVIAAVEGAFAGSYVPNDYDGDGASDIVVQNESSGQWYFQLSSWGFAMSALGQSGRVSVPGDFDGDGRSDPAVCDPSAGAFYILKSSDNSLTLTTVNSLAGNSPIGGCDFNGDGITDPTLFDPASGKWYSTAEDTATTGISGSEPLWGDYDGDGQSDRAAYDPTSGQWFAGLSRMEEDLSFTWIPGCEGLNADFDNDNKADPALYHEASGTWYVLLSDADYAYVTLPFGGSGFTPVPGDYDGDGKSDPAVYHESSGYWYRLLSASDYALDTVWFGAPGYKPVK